MNLLQAPIGRLLLSRVGRTLAIGQRPLPKREQPSVEQRILRFERLSQLRLQAIDPSCLCQQRLPL